MSHRTRLLLGVMTGACLVFASLQGMSTYARYSDGTTIAASAGAGSWVSTTPPAECAGMTFAGDPIVGTEGPAVSFAIGSATGRERVVKSGSIWVGAGSFKKKK